MDNPLYYVGIDIAKAKFDVAIKLQNGKHKHKVFKNNPEGFQSLMQWLNTFGETFHCVMEATNIYHEALADFLFQQQITVSVINPKCSAHFTKTDNLRSKTDKIDAKMLADYADEKRHKLPIYQPISPAQRELLRKNRQLDHLKKQLAQEKTRLTMLLDSDCIASTQQMITFIKAQIKALEKTIKQCINADNTLKNNVKLLCTIPAIGFATAVQLIAHLGDGNRFKNAKAAATFAGLTPMIKSSGKSLNTVIGISKIGQSDIRKALFCPAMNFAFGSYKNSVYRSFVLRLLECGKPKMVIITALMRKLVTIAQAVLQKQTAFNLDTFMK
ncbi:IS110 family transposase [Glaesserella parasuis]|nr:IS110 family transposase [Glaesserella parasuis]